MEKKHKLIAGGVLIGLLLIFMIYVNLPSAPPPVDPAAANEFKEHVVEGVPDAPPPPPLAPNTVPPPPTRGSASRP